MSWEELSQAKQQFLERQKKLEKIAQIVATQAEWQQQIPELKELIQSVKKAA